MNNEDVCMDIRGFAEEVCKEVSRELGENYQVKLQEVTKNNGVILQGLVILAQERNISPTIYLNSFLEAYEAGVPIYRLVDRILEIYREDSPARNLDMSFFRQFERVKDRICYRLVNRAKNRVLLERIPHVDVLDLSVCFYYAYEDALLGSGSILIYNNHLEMWNSSVEELMELAEENTPRLFPWEVHSMEELLSELMHEEEIWEPEDFSEELKMQILSNSKRIQGAVCMLYPRVLDYMADRMGGSFYILPSSIHEVILLQEQCAEEEDTLRDMVREINITQVEPEEVLSDSIYFFDHIHSKITVR